MSEAALLAQVERPPRRFRRYVEYKDSGVEWLGQIPRHWDVSKTKFVARLRSGHTPSRQQPEYWEDCAIPWFGLADVWQIREGRRDYVTETAEKISELGLRNSAARLLPKGTVLLSRTASVGFSAIMGVDMATTQDFVNWVCSRRLRPEYLLYVFRSMQQEFRRLMMGSTHQTIYMPDVGRFATALPPLEEQDRIVAFIRSETKKIDALVAKKERLVELLEEKRFAEIYSSVTLGLRSSANLRDSGDEWLGSVPTHWEVLPLGYLTLAKCDGPFGSGLKSEHYSLGGVRVIRLQNIGWASFANRDQTFVDQEYSAGLGDHSVRLGDLLIAGLGDASNPVGRACVAPEDLGPAMVKADCFRFRLRGERILPRFAAYQLSAVASLSAGSLATGATRARMNLTSTARRAIALPPMNEQRSIIDALDSLGEAHASGLMKIRTAIAHLHELRTALISAVVTGKIDVREEVAP